MIHKLWTFKIHKQNIYNFQMIKYLNITHQIYQKFQQINKKISINQIKQHHFNHLSNKLTNKTY
jgi:hypothetical protein